MQSILQKLLKKLNVIPKTYTQSGTYTLLLIMLLHQPECSTTDIKKTGESEND